MYSKKLNILIPVYNEGKNILKLINELIKKLSKNKIFNYQIYILDDGSNDSTQLVIEKKISKYKKKLSYILFQKNYGKDKILAYSLKLIGSKNDVLMMDGDGQHTPEDAVKIIKASYKNKNDIICGSRSNRKYQSIISRLFTSIFYKIFNLITNKELDSSIGDFNYIKAHAVRNIIYLNDKDPFFKEIIQNNKFKLQKIPISIRKPYTEKTTSFFSGFKLGLKNLMKDSYFPLVFGLLISFFSIFFGVIYFLNILHKYFVLGINVPGYTSIIVLLIFFSSVIIILLTFIGFWNFKIIQFLKSENNCLVKKKI